MIVSFRVMECILVTWALHLVGGSVFLIHGRLHMHSGGKGAIMAPGMAYVKGGFLKVRKL